MHWQARFSPISNPRAGLWLAGISAAVTATSWLYPPLWQYALNAGFFLERDWGNFALQIGIYQFLHLGFYHWVANALFLWVIAPRVEVLAGRRAFWWLFLGNTFFGALALLLFSSRSTVGISGFCMALITWYSLKIMKSHSQEAQAGFILVGINVAMGLFSNVSLIGHASGAVFGALFWVGQHLFRRR